MDKTAIKNYAIWARVQLIESCKQRAFEYGVTEEGNYASNLKTIGSRILTDQEVDQRNQLIGQINQKGYAQVMEEAAYTWFNRFIALRFMEVNGYLPSKVRVFTDETGAFKPEILKEAMMVDLEGIDRAFVIDLLERQDNETLYKYLLITQCNALSTGLPYMFEKISNWTELLFPANLLRNDSVVGRMVTDIPEEDWTDAVQIIGWLYQYYNSELKDETFALLKKNVKITKERIPAATQLFTPDWIVRYMVENSLGRLWYEGHKDFDKSQWKYYLDEAEQEPEVEAELAKIRAEYSQIRPEDIKVIDPCMGSGHILVYAFDVLMQIYTSAGWSERDAARSIIENNLYGLEIDDRAGQLAYFAVMMKARKYSRRIMSLDIKPNVMSIQDSSFMTNELIDFVAGNVAEIKADLRKVKEVFTDAKEYGSILNVPSLGYNTILERIDEMQNVIAEDIFQVEHKNVAIEQLRPLINQAIVMSQKYDVVVTNPPYMRNRGMNIKLDKYVKKNYEPYKSDLYSVFISKCQHFMNTRAYLGMITQQSFMFLSRFEQIRKDFYLKRIINFVQLGTKAFEEIGGEVVQTATYILNAKKINNYSAVYKRLVDYDSAEQKEQEFFNQYNNYITAQEKYSAVPGGNIAYWISTDVIKAFENNKFLGEIAYPRKGNSTSNNDKFLRLWFEVSRLSLNLGAREIIIEDTIKRRWFPYNKGGSYRKWYGNNDYVVDWKNDAEEMRNIPSAVIANYQFFTKPGITWSTISGGNIGARRFGDGFIFDNKGECLFADTLEELDYYAGYLNSKVAMLFLSFLSPTLDFNCGYISKLPIVITDERKKEKIILNVRENVSITKEDWDSFETSWDFKRHPLV